MRPMHALTFKSIYKSRRQSHKLEENRERRLRYLFVFCRVYVVKLSRKMQLRRYRSGSQSRRSTKCIREENEKLASKQSLRTTQQRNDGEARAEPVCCSVHQPALRQAVDAATTILTRWADTTSLFSRQFTAVREFQRESRRARLEIFIFSSKFC